MKSYVVTEFGTPLQAVETPTPKPQGTEVLLKTLAAGVCHSDLHIWDGYYDLGGGKKIALKENGIAPPITLGHEIAGEIVATGPDAVGVKLGQSYVAYPWIGCGQCPACRQGREQLCIDPRTLGIRRPVRPHVHLREGLQHHDIGRLEIGRLFDARPPRQQPLQQRGDAGAKDD